MTPIAQGPDHADPRGDATRVLVVGGGQIGMAAAAVMAEAGGHRFSIHCRTEDGMMRARAYARAAELPVESYSHGDLVTGSAPVFPAGAPGLLPPGASAAAALVSATRPHLVVDATNMATVLAGWEDQSAALRLLTRYTVDVVQAAVGLGARIVKVSTTALGGMGIDIPFSHGDVPAQTLPPRMWAKLFLSGAQLQVLWTLARTYPAHGIHALIPAACVVGGGSLLLEVPGAKIREEGGARVARPDPDRRIALVTAYGGEGPTYTRAELSLLAGPSSMGALTSREVGEAIANMLAGDSGHDALRALQSSVLGPSLLGNHALNRICGQLAARESELESDGFATGHLGYHVTQAMFELAAVARALGGRWLVAILVDDPADIGRRVADALTGDSSLVAQIMARRMGLTDATGRWEFPDTPSDRSQVDVRPRAIAWWQETLRAAVDDRLLKIEDETEWLDVLTRLLSSSTFRARLRSRG